MTYLGPAQRCCSLCGAEGRLLHEGLDDRLFEVVGRWSLRECEACGLVWRDPFPAPEDIASYYADYYTHDDPDEASLLHRVLKRGVPAAALGYADVPVTTAERQLGRIAGWIGPLRELAARSIMDLPAESRGRLLDVGCGSGAFLVRMRRLGWDVSGLEPDPKAARVARAALPGADVRCAQIEEAGFEPGSFAAVTLSHVIEHVLDPVETLRFVGGLLEPGGRLMLATPNSRSLGARRFGPHWLGWDPPRHLHLFHRENLSRAVERAGLRVKSVHTPSSSGYFIWQASRLIERNGRLPGVDLASGSLALKLRGLGFWGRAYLGAVAGADCGEELLLAAERTPVAGPG